MDFRNKISCRLINPSKSSIRKISKVILDKMNQQIKLITKTNQWKDISSVIKWFNNFENKEWSSFMIFDNESLVTISVVIVIIYALLLYIQQSNQVMLKVSDDLCIKIQAGTLFC